MSSSHGQVEAGRSAGLVFALLGKGSTAKVGKIAEPSAERRSPATVIATENPIVRAPAPVNPIGPAVRVLRSFLYLNGMLNQLVDRYIDVLIELEQSANVGPSLLSRAGKLVLSVEFVEQAVNHLVTVFDRARLASDEPDNDALIGSIEGLMRSCLRLAEAKSLPDLTASGGGQPAVGRLRDWTATVWLEATRIFESASRLVTGLLDQMPQRIAESTATVHAGRSEQGRAENTGATIH